ncbi:hybrid sensor histidine kinase/response regulator transcription factor [Arcticibacter eurypsychrophilus]|uniref:hybrid sensor histidine kinase/response regulator transcription factor n=1 Tax=Arcticibacter eurypsychrophilus TaxID=1434752 RepID=UPI00084D4AD9|nr:two-component regulator propeller domain-containing protein [Arcticibacter eurypsychrophilus]
MLAYPIRQKTQVNKNSVLLFLLIWCIKYSYAQTNINFTYPNEGLSSSTIHAILKDRHGLMWMATDDGLNKFDGTTFTVYRNEPGNKNTLQANEITALDEDKQGRIWIGTNGGSVSIYNYLTNSFTSLPAEGGENQLSSKAVTSISSDYLGQIWVGTYGGLNRINPKTKAVTRFMGGAGDPSKLSSKNVICVFEDSKHNLWVGTDAGLNLYNRKTNKFITYVHNPANPISLSDNYIQTIAEDQAGNIWIGTLGGGLNLLLPDKNNFKAFKHTDDPKSLSSDIIYAIADEGNGRLWLGTEDGLNIMDIHSGLVQRIKPNSRNKYSLTSKSIRSILIDKQGIYWLGTYQGGLNKYDKNLTFFNLKTSNGNDPYGLSAPVVSSFAEDESGDLFIGTDGGGLNRFNHKTGLFRHIMIDPLNKSSSTGLAILALEMSKSNQLWIGTYLNGIFVFNPATERYKQLKKGTTPYDLNDNDIFSIMEDSKGKIWIGTNGGGANVYDQKNKVITKYITANDEKSISSNFVRALEEDIYGRIWIGTYGAGITVFDPTTRVYKYYRKSSNTLPADVILSILEDKKGNIWAGTIGAGLCLLDKNSGKFISYSLKEGLANNVVHKIIEDDQGLIWVSTNKGISRFNTQTKRFKNYSNYNGSQNNEFVQGSGKKTATGEIYFGGLNGFNYFNPKNLTSNKNIPAVLITDLKIANRSIVPGGEDSLLKAQISFAHELTIGYKQSFTIEYVALNYTTPQQNQYAYMLEGFDKTWNYVHTENTASYTNLDPGEYIFRVKASNNDGIWNEQGASIKIIIKPPYWRTLYAYLFYLAVAISLLLFIRHRGIRKIKRKYALDQERQEAKQLLLNEHKEAERLREMDLSKIKFLTNISHEFRTPISLILGPVDKMLNKHNSPDDVNQLNMVHRNARRLLNLVNQLLDFRKLEEQELKLAKSKGEIISFIKEVTESFLDIAEKKGILLDFLSDTEWLYTAFDHDKIERILFNLLSNAFKFTTEGGHVSVKVNDEYDKTTGFIWLTIKVIDTGIGIAKDKQDKIFDRFFQAEVDPAILNQGSGIGLSITKEFVKVHDGHIQVQSEPGKGSCFTIRLPFIAEDILDFVEKTSVETNNFDEIIEQEHLLADSPMGGVEMPHILLVEDNYDLRFYLKDNLKPFFKVSEAENGKEGWQKALSLHPHLIVSDISMPLMNGIDLCRKIKSDKRTSHIPIILLTAITGKEGELRGLKTGANDYLTKPFDFEILLSKIKNLLTMQETFKNTFTKQIKLQPQEIEIESGDIKFINTVVSYIEDKLTNPQLSVEDLSKHLNMGRSSLYRKILNLTGETPVEYIRSVRLEKARLLLENSDLNIAQICYMVGFNMPNYFAKAFKAKYNMLPSQYMNLRKQR